MMIGGESSSYPNPYGRYMMMCPIKNNSREQKKKSKEDIKVCAIEKIQVRLDIYSLKKSSTHYQRRIVSFDLSQYFFKLKDQCIPLLSEEVNIVHTSTKDNILSQPIFSKEETKYQLDTSTFPQNSKDVENPYVSLNYARNLSFTKNEDGLKKGRYCC